MFRALLKNNKYNGHYFDRQTENRHNGILSNTFKKAIIRHMMDEHGVGEDEAMTRGTSRKVEREAQGWKQEIVGPGNLGSF